MTDSIQKFLDEWTAAEQAGDIEKIGALLTDDFAGVGPLGFILPKQAWLGRHRPGGITYDGFTLSEVDVRTHGTTAVVIARNDTPGTFQGVAIPEAVRAGLVLVADDGGWRLSSIHMSFIAGTAGAPPLPAAARGNAPEQE